MGHDASVCWSPLSVHLPLLLQQPKAGLLGGTASWPDLDRQRYTLGCSLQNLQRQPNRKSTAPMTAVDFHPRQILGVHEPSFGQMILTIIFSTVVTAEHQIRTNGNVHASTSEHYNGGFEIFTSQAAKRGACRSAVCPSLCRRRWLADTRL